jgi:hypothetical protein
MEPVPIQLIHAQNDEKGHSKKKYVTEKERNLYPRCKFPRGYAGNTSRKFRDLTGNLKCPGIFNTTKARFGIKYIDTLQDI